VKKEIKNIPFQTLLDKGEKEPFLAELKEMSSWVLPQVLAMLAEETKLKVNDDGQYCARETALANDNLLGLGSAWTYGIYSYLCTAPRGNILAGTQSAIHNLEYAANVPLYLSAFKKYKNIPYSAWSVKFLNAMVDSDCFSMMTELPKEEYSLEDLLHFRDVAALIKTGKTAGKVRTSNQMTTINKVGHPSFDKLPRLTKVALLQVWICHPSLRNKYMVLNPLDWDNMPEPLISTSIENYIPKAVYEETEKTSEYPWQR